MSLITEIETTVSDSTFFTGPSSPTTLIIIETYSQFYSLMRSNKLVQAAIYSVPYRCVNYLNGYASAVANSGTDYPEAYQARAVHRGAEERLLLKASSAWSVDLVTSQLYPEDTISFNPNMITLGVPQTYESGATLNDGNVMGEFALQWDFARQLAYLQMPFNQTICDGHILYLNLEYAGGATFIQGGFNVVMSSPYGNVIQQYDENNTYSVTASYSSDNKRMYISNINYSQVLGSSNLSLYAVYATPNAEACGYISQRTDPVRNVAAPFDIRAVTYRRYNVDLSSISSLFTVGPWSTKPTFEYNTLFFPGVSILFDGTYVDVPAIPNNLNCFNFVWEGVGDPDQNYVLESTSFSSDNTVFHNLEGVVKNVSVKNCKNVSYSTVINCDKLSFTGDLLYCIFFEIETSLFPYCESNIICNARQVTWITPDANTFYRNVFNNFSVLTINATIANCWMNNVANNVINAAITGTTNTNVTVYASSPSFSFNYVNSQIENGIFIDNNVIYNFFNNGGLISATLKPEAAFQYNTLEEDLSGDLTAATHIYNNYSKTIQKNEAGNPVVLYINSVNTLSIENATS